MKIDCCEDQSCQKCKGRARSLSYYYENKDDRKAYAKKWRAENKEYNAARLKDWRKRNKEKNAKYMREYSKKYIKNRSSVDVLFKLQRNLRTLIYVSLIRQGYSKKSKAASILGADIETVHKHLIASAVRNYGKYFPKRQYHIDHIVPCASAKTEEELIKLQHYTNLQYLYPKDNIKKSDTLTCGEDSVQLLDDVKESCED